MGLNSDFRGKQVLITGHTGFKGSWLTQWLVMQGAKVTGASLNSAPDSHYKKLELSKYVDDFYIDIRDPDGISQLLTRLKPDYIFHLAAQALVKQSYENPLETWTTNVIGTANILDAARRINERCCIIIITSDKCYENQEWFWGYRETDVLGGVDPYSASKAGAELVASSFQRSYFSQPGSQVRIATARAGNVVGGGDWSKDRIVPDCVRSWLTKSTLELRSPNATRPWQHVLEPLGGYLLLASELQKDDALCGQAFNFGPTTEEEKTVKELVNELSQYWPAFNWTFALDSDQHHHEAGLLRLNCDKALAMLSWKNYLSFSEVAKMTADWYFSTLTEEVSQVTIRQIEDYMDLISRTTKEDEVRD